MFVPVDSRLEEFQDKIFCNVSVAAEIRCICTEAGIMALRQERKTVSEKDLMDAIDKINAKKLNAINLTTGSYN